MIKIAQITGDDLNEIRRWLEPIKTTSGGPFSGDNPLVAVIWNIVGVLLLIAIYGFLLAILIGGAQYLISGGNEETIGKAKKTFTNSIIGLIVVFSSYQLLSYITNTFGPAIGNGSILDIVAGIYKIVLGVGGSIFTILLAMGGVLYLTAGGNDEQVQKAKKMLTSSIIGITIIAFAFAIGKGILLLLNIPVTS